MNTGFTFPAQSSDDHPNNPQDHFAGTNTNNNNSDFIFPRSAEHQDDIQEFHLNQQQEHIVQYPQDPIHHNFAIDNPNIPVIAIPSPIEIPEMNNDSANTAQRQTSTFSMNHSPIGIPDVAELRTPNINTYIQQEPAIPVENDKAINTNINSGIAITPTESTNQSASEEYVTNLRQQMATDWKNPSEYALHILFTKFIRFAENKLNLCLQHPLSSEPSIVDIIGEGVDPEFDNVIESLGHVAKKKPKPVIDAMMFWRKTKSEAANLASDELERLFREYDIDQQLLQQQDKKLQSPQNVEPLGQLQNQPNIKRSNSKMGSLHRSTSRSIMKTITSRNASMSGTGDDLLKHKRNTSSKSSKSSVGGGRFSSDFERSREIDMLIEKTRINALQEDRKSLISIYILCRVLIEIVKQTPEEGDDELNDKLEEIVFTQLKTTDPISVSSSIIKSSNWNAFAELLGYMSEKKFVSVSDRFISDLEKIPKHISLEMEPTVHLLILGMRYLRLKNYPLEKFEESADFMESLSKFFANTTNLSVRLAYAEVTNQLLLPMAGSLTAEVNHPTWLKAMTLLLQTSKKLQADNKYWASGFKLTVSILCASPPNLFTEQWITLIESNISKIRTKNLLDRVIFAVGISRLVWVFLYRCTETLNNTTRTLTNLLKLYLNTKKKENWITTDLELINPLSDVLVSIGYLHPNFLMENAVIPLIRQSFNGSSLDNINYERMLLALNTYKGFIMTTEKPEFPENDSRYYEINLNKLSINQNKTLNINNEEVCSYFNKLFILLDSNIGSEVWSPENQHQKQPSTPFSSFGFNFSNDNESSMNRNLNIALFATVIEVIPCCLSVSSNIPYKSTIEILSRNAVHDDLLIATSCQNALKSLASKKNPYTLITWFAKYSFDFDEKTQSSYNMSYLSSKEYNKLAC